MLKRLTLSKKRRISQALRACVFSTRLRFLKIVCFFIFPEKLNLQLSIMIQVYARQNDESILIIRKRKRMREYESEQ